MAKLEMLKLPSVKEHQLETDWEPNPIFLHFSCWCSCTKNVCAVSSRGEETSEAKDVNSLTPLKASDLQCVQHFSDKALHFPVSRGCGNHSLGFPMPAEWTCRESGTAMRGHCVDPRPQVL